MSIPQLSAVPVPAGCIPELHTIVAPPVSMPYCMIPRYQVLLPNGTALDGVTLLELCCLGPAVAYGNEFGNGPGDCWAFCPVTQANAQKAYTCLQTGYVKGINFFNCSGDYQFWSPGKSKITSAAIRRTDPINRAWVWVLLLGVWLWFVCAL